MFTGLIAGQGELIFIEKKGMDTRFGIRAHFPFNAPVLGESVAINGACLTVESFSENNLSEKTLTFFVSGETLACTTLATLQKGAYVNMERALAFGDRLGGHLVSGHVDCIGTILHIQDRGQSRQVRVGFSKEIAPYIIPKGSIALDGVSLTVNDCGMDFLEVNIIPETWKVTSISRFKVGQQINMETDMIGKYILRSKQVEQEKIQFNVVEKSRIDTDFLRENGFM